MLLFICPQNRSTICHKLFQLTCQLTCQVECRYLQNLRSAPVLPSKGLPTRTLDWTIPIPLQHTSSVDFVARNHSFSSKAPMTSLQQGPSKPKTSTATPPLPKSLFAAPRAPRQTKPESETNLLIRDPAPGDEHKVASDARQQQHHRHQPPGSSDTRPWQLSLASVIASRRKTSQRSLSRSRRRSLLLDDSSSATARSDSWFLQPELQNDTKNTARRSDAFDVQRPKDGELPARTRRKLHATVTC